MALTDFTHALSYMEDCITRPGEIISEFYHVFLCQDQSFDCIVPNIPK